MITGLQTTTSLYKFLVNKLAEDADSPLLKNRSVKVFKDDDKNADYSGIYIAVNALPFTYGPAVNSDNVMNLNIHVPNLTSGKADRALLTEFVDYLLTIFPLESFDEDSTQLMIDGVYYTIRAISKPMKDDDDTYFVNVKLKLLF